MIRSTLTHHAPERLADATALLAEHGAAAAVLGGGTVLLPAMVRGERTHRHVVDLRRLELVFVQAEAGWAEIGAMTTYAQVLASEELTGSAALLRRAAAGITGGAQLRNQGTVAGSAAYANPASDMPGCLVAAGAVLRLHGPDGPREVPAAEFFRGAFTTALRPAEMVVTVRVPLRPARIGYYKLKLSESSWPIATAAVTVEVSADGVTSAAVTLGAVAAQPITIDVAEHLSAQGALRDEIGFDEFVRSRVDEPWDDELAPASYRREVAGVVARRALKQTEDGEQR
ncbi:MAG: aerobic carbon-monoxide dehydrogenase medium subunit [Pseudonocardiales bacterium]|jgi:carbon-monoxide dehydrogenase medium subunit|nr:aerobic carbon-monoxide dehydrogenase medium subunit [Pseudonocardiales bacterium]